MNLTREEYSKQVELSIDRIEEAYTFSQHLGLGKLYVAFSGGKDSICLYSMCEKTAKRLNLPLNEMFEFYYNITNLDPPELVHFIRNKYPNVHRIVPKENVWNLIIRKKTPPTSLARYCCEVLKEHGGEGRFCLTGVRRAESLRRSKRGEFETIGDRRTKGKILYLDNAEDRRELEHCIPKHKYICNPIIDWSTDFVWQYIFTEGLEYCELYDEGYERLGCIGCPMAYYKARQKEFERYPKYKEQFIRTFDRMLEERKKQNLPTIWQTGEEVMKWWMREET